MQQDDASACPLRRGRGDDLLDSGPAPVLSVEVGEDDVVAPARDRLDRACLARVGRRWNGGVGRPEEPRADADRPRQRVVREPDLQPLLPAGERRDVAVRERVVAELEALAMQPSNDVWMAHDLAADDEERRRDVKTGQRFGDARRPARARAVVERERNLLAGIDVARLEPPLAPRQDRPLAGERSPVAGSGRCATTRRPRRQALGPEQDEHGREQQAEDEPAGSGPSRGGQISPSSAAAAVGREPSSPGRAGREAVRRAASGRRGGHDSAAAVEWPSPCGPGPEAPRSLSAPSLAFAERDSRLRPAEAGWVAAP